MWYVFVVDINIAPHSKLVNYVLYVLSQVNYNHKLIITERRILGFYNNPLVLLFSRLFFFTSYFLTYSKNIHVFWYPRPVPGEMLSQAVVPVWLPRFCRLLQPESPRLRQLPRYMVPG